MPTTPARPGRPRACSKIDIHTHVLNDEAVIGERLAANRILGFSRGVLLTGTDTQKTNNVTAPLLPQDAYEICRRYPETFAWMCNIDPDGTESTYRKIKEYKEMGAVGLGEFTIRYRFDDPRMEHLFACLEELRLPFLAHMAPADAEWCYGVVDDPRLPGLEHALQKYPGLIFIGHSQPFWFEIAETDETDPARRYGFPSGKTGEGRLYELMRRYDNLYCDLAANSAMNAIMRDPEQGLRFIDEFQDRLLFGTDWLTGTPFGLMMSAWLDYMHMKGQILDEAYEKICCKNAERLFFAK